MTVSYYLVRILRDKNITRHPRVSSIARCEQDINASKLRFFDWRTVALDRLSNVADGAESVISIISMNVMKYVVTIHDLETSSHGHDLYMRYVLAMVLVNCAERGCRKWFPSCYIFEIHNCVLDPSVFVQNQTVKRFCSSALLHILCYDKRWICWNWSNKLHGQGNCTAMFDIHFPVSGLSQTCGGRESE
jgi:hypothetical protein